MQMLQALLWGKEDVLVLAYGRGSVWWYCHWGSPLEEGV